jgi:eukaryotic-like serine/threonine-protein kinase
VSTDDWAKLDARLRQAIGGAAGELAESSVAPWRGRTLGAYLIEDRIAAGGMGVVYRARRADEQFERGVAIKVLSSTLASDDAQRRFRTERQILANFSHPNIAQLLDGGTTDEGVPYLVMEYIEGLPIDEYCTRNALPVAARLRLFMQVCAAVQYAHQRLVVHRDVKPSNVLVTGAGVPKLLDFGIAKLLEGAEGRAAASQTVADARLLTPRNASPEQIRGAPITTASDIYSLGVLLYELLTEQPPYDVSSLAPTGLQAAICEKDPDPPSSRRKLASDLDNIVMTAMRKEPERRYASAAALAEDIGRFLESRPVQARPNAWSYRARKFMRRNWIAVSGSAAACVAIAAVVTFYTLRVAAERDRAEIAAAKSRETAEFLTDIFRGSDPSTAQGRPLTAIELLDRSARNINEKFHGQPVVRSDLLATMAESYKNLSAYDRSGPMYEQSLAIRDAEGLHHTYDYASILYSLANLRRFEGRFADSERDFKEVLKILERISPGPNEDTAQTLTHLGTLYYEMGRHAESLEAQQRALAMSMSLHGEHHEETADKMNNIALVLRELDRYAEAEQYLRKALKVRGDLLGPRHPGYLTTHYNLGLVLKTTGRVEEAARIQREVLAVREVVLGAEHVYIGTTLTALGDALTELGKFDEAREVLERGQRILAARLSPDHWRVATVLRELGELSLERGDAAHAAAPLQRAYDISAKTYGEQSEEAHQAQVILAAALLAQGDLARAGTMLETSCEYLRKNSGPDSSRITRCLQELGGLRIRQDRFSEAQPLLEQALRNHERISGPDGARAREVREQLAQVRSRVELAANQQ